MQRYSDGRSPSTAVLTAPGSSRQPSTNRRFGYSALSCHCLLVLFVLCSLSVLHKNHSPTRSRKSFDKRENKNNVQQLNYYDYAELVQYCVCETGGLHELYKFSPVLQLKIEIREVKSQAVEFPERRVPVDRAGILCE